MVTVSSPPPQLSSSSPAPGGEDADVKRMDDLLEKLKKNMVDLILQGDDVTRQMWHMYSVFEEIFGHPAAATSTGERPLKQVVVGDKIKKASQQKAITSPEKAAPATVATTPPASAATTIVTTASSSFASSTNVVPAVQVSKITSPESSNATPSPQNKVSPGATSPSTTSVVNNRGSPPSSDRPSDTSSAKSEHAVHTRPTSDSSSPSPAVLNATSNPLLDTIGVLATSNADSDDSDLDIVYQQLRYRGRHRRPEQVRVRTHRSTQHRHQHQQVASSDPESIGYAGSNSIDSGYKSLCATPEVSDSLSSAPEVRRSASDVSASDSSTTSGRPRSLDGQDSKSSKIKMGTRSIAGKTRLPERSSPRHTAIDDVTLDHLMYLRQSLRKDAQRSPSDSIPSSVTSSTYRDSDLSPRNEEWRDQVRSSYPYRGGTSSSSDSTFTGSRASSRGEDIDQEGGGESSSDFLLSGVEYYDLESIQEFPPTTSSYVTMLEEKTRRFQLISASKCPDPLGERHLSSLYRKRSESTQSVNGGGMSRSQHHHQQQSVYSMTSSPIRPPRNSAKALSRHHRQHHATDSKLTEAAIRVLEMIEDFRMGETMSRSGGGRMMPYHEPPPPPPGPSSAPGYPSSAIPRDVYMPRYRKNSGLRTGVRPASAGSLMEHEIDARSVASASSYSASAEHHVCEEIMYDLVCERAAAAAGDRSVVPPPPIPPDRGGRMVRNRLLPVPPQHAASSSSHHQQVYAVDPRRVVVRSSHHKQQRSSNLYSMLSGVHGRGNVDRFLEMEWHLAQERRDNLPPDFPV